MSAAREALIYASLLTETSEPFVSAVASLDETESELAALRVELQAARERIKELELGGGSAAVAASDAASGNSARGELFRRIEGERYRQDAKWGGRPGLDRRDEHTYAAVLGEECGEVCKAWLERDLESLRDELVQVAAVAVAWLEEITNGGTVRA